MHCTLLTCIKYHYPALFTFRGAVVQGPGESIDGVSIRYIWPSAGLQSLGYDGLSVCVPPLSYN